MKPGQQAILVAANGAYSFKGSGYVRGGIFDRFEVLRGGDGIHFRGVLHARVGNLLAPGVPGFRDIDIFRTAEGTSFDPAQAWRLQLLVQRGCGARDKALPSFDAPYELRRGYFAAAAPAPVASNAAPTVAAQSISSFEVREPAS